MFNLESNTIIVDNDGYVVAEVWNNGEHAALLSAAPEMYALLDSINAAFYARTSRKEWIEIMSKTKPLLQKARGIK